jgi:quercetin dioxygenase-like cupin family protein
MTPNGRDERADESAALFAAGALPADEAAAFETLLKAGSIEFGAVGEFAGVVAALAGVVPPVEPPAGAKEKLLASLPPAPAGIHFRFADDGAFTPTRYPGVSIKLLHLDRQRRQFTVLMKLEPGAVYPAHAHDGPEECVVIEGEILVGGVRMRQGDYQRAEPGSEHVDQRSETGALLFVTAPVSLMSR